MAERFVALNKLAKTLEAGNCTTNPGLVFSDYSIDKSALQGSDFYKKHQEGVKNAVEAVNAKKSTI